MKKRILSNFFENFQIRDCSLPVAKNGFRMDLSGVKYSHSPTNTIVKTPETKSIFSKFSLFILLFLFSTISFAQQPACNLDGVLEVKRLRDGGQNFTINSEVYKSVPGSIYRWEFKSNTSAASFATQNGQPSITINPGNKTGEFNLKLTIINPATAGRSSKMCSCIKSVSIGNL